MLGDTQVTLPSYEATLGVTINTAPAAIWPWLMQMAYRRGGLYSYDWLDRLFGYLDAPSADHILPEWQLLEVSDEIPIGRTRGFPDKAIEPFRTLVLCGRTLGAEKVGGMNHRTASKRLRASIFSRFPATR